MKKRFNEIKVGECFKYYGVAYRKTYTNATQMTGNSYLDRYFWNDDMVIPVTVTIKVKEK